MRHALAELFEARLGGGRGLKAERAGFWRQRGGSTRHGQNGGALATDAEFECDGLGRQLFSFVVRCGFSAAAAPVPAVVNNVKRKTKAMGHNRTDIRYDSQRWTTRVQFCNTFDGHLSVSSSALEVNLGGP